MVLAFLLGVLVGVAHCQQVFRPPNRPPGQYAPPSSGPTGPITVADVVGLPANLADRPVKSPTFTPNRAAKINADGAIESVAGASGDCVRVDGSSVPCGSGGIAIPVTAQPTKTGFFTYQLPDVPSYTPTCFLNGARLTEGVDYTRAGAVLTFVSAYFNMLNETGASNVLTCDYVAVTLGALRQPQVRARAFAVSHEPASDREWVLLQVVEQLADEIEQLRKRLAALEAGR
jgi:hypothetical protein